MTSQTTSNSSLHYSRHGISVNLHQQPMGSVAFSSMAQCCISNASTRQATSLQQKCSLEGGCIEYGYTWKTITVHICGVKTGQSWKALEVNVAWTCQRTYAPGNRSLIADLYRKKGVLSCPNFQLLPASATFAAAIFPHLPHLQVLKGIFHTALVVLPHIFVHLPIVVPNVFLSAPVGNSAKFQRWVVILGSLELSREAKWNWKMKSTQLDLSLPLLTLLPEAIAVQE